MWLVIWATEQGVWELLLITGTMGHSPAKKSGSKRTKMSWITEGPALCLIGVVFAAQMAFSCPFFLLICSAIGYLPRGSNALLTCLIRNLLPHLPEWWDCRHGLYAEFCNLFFSHWSTHCDCLSMLIYPQQSPSWKETRSTTFQNVFYLVTFLFLCIESCILILFSL